MMIIIKLRNCKRQDNQMLKFHYSNHGRFNKCHNERNIALDIFNNSFVKLYVAYSFTLPILYYNDYGNVHCLVFGKLQIYMHFETLKIQNAVV